MSWNKLPLAMLDITFFTFLSLTKFLFYTDKEFCFTGKVLFTQIWDKYLISHMLSKQISNINENTDLCLKLIE